LFLGQAVSETQNDGIGHLLREAREKKGLPLEEAEKVTRIRAKFLAALEEDDYAALSSAAQARGFLNNYAEFLGLDAGQVVDWYDGWRKRPRGQNSMPLAARPAAPHQAERPAGATRPAARPAPKPTLGQAPKLRSRRPRWLSADVFVGVTFTLVLGTFLLWGALQLASGHGFALAGTATPTPKLTPLAGVASVTPPPAEAMPTEPLPTPLAVYNGVNLIVRAEQRTWVRALVDGNEAFAGLMPPGTSKEFDGQTVVELVTGNGQGTRVIWNGRDQGTLGQSGEVVIRLWTRDGAITPTPTNTLPPSQTPAPSATPRP
jgi:hypothetical protein